MKDSQDIESATTAVNSQPDSKTRRYDRQLRLWAATGQAALENARILVISGSATSTSILKNLVLPGIGHFTILDDAVVTPADAGNNFFLEGPSSIGKSRAEEAVRLLKELNEGVEGKADTRNIAELLKSEEGRSWLSSFTVVIAHNLQPSLMEQLSTLLWETSAHLIAVHSAGFLAEFSIQFHEHQIIESHSDTAPSLRIDNAFPALLEYAISLDLQNMDPTDHSHIPYVPILVRAREDWKKSHGGSPPTSKDKVEFKALIQSMKVKFDEENFDEADAQAYRSWTKTGVPFDVAPLLQDPRLSDDSLSESSPPFLLLLFALKKFSEAYGVLPLSSALPDMKASTESYIQLQKLYKDHAESEKQLFKSYLPAPVPDDLVDAFVKNAHALRILHGRKWGTWNKETAVLAEKLTIYPRETSTHLALAALSAVSPAAASSTATSPPAPLNIEQLTSAAQALLPPGTELPDAFGDAVGEISRAPSADLPNTAAFLGGLVAQEAIKMITKQYVPIGGELGLCVCDLVETWTGVI